ncbi:uncharacterized protein LOC108136763 [Drosophila elegans]|uniref:uncharacterized protein LOC108136763 n=1 Tax=Drosophila elegans TaxID=30023 RepID=UPI0007E780F6|nr:uncharacterized protein LOC108136763 [Drosophila elegans]
MDEFLNLILGSILFAFEGVDGEDTRLIYYFSRPYELLRGCIFLTTYVERRRREYFAGFSNVNLMAPFQDDQQTQCYRWIHLSLIFRASRSATFP